MRFSVSSGDQSSATRKKHCCLRTHQTCQKMSKSLIKPVETMISCPKGIPNGPQGCKIPYKTCRKQWIRVQKRSLYRLTAQMFFFMSQRGILLDFSARPGNVFFLANVFFPAIERHDLQLAPGRPTGDQIRVP